MKIPTQYQRIMPIGQFKAMWQFKWLDLVGTLQHLIIPAARGSLPMHCTAPIKVLIYSCTVTQLTKNSSVVKWGESYWRACEGIAWVRVASSIQSDTQFFFPDCIITAKCILLHHGNGLKLYWLEYQSVFRSNLPCTVFHGNALQRLQCAATVLLELEVHTHSGNAKAVCAQPSKPNWS